MRLFWPLVAGKVGFAAPARPPVFLNYEAAQYLMGQVVEPLLAEGYFEGLYLRPQRILSQLLDNLNKAAVADFALDEVAPRLSQRLGWGRAAVARVRAGADVYRPLPQTTVLRHGLLDASLVFEVCNRHLVAQEEFWRYFTERYHHLLVDSAEELVPVAGDLVSATLAAGATRPCWVGTRKLASASFWALMRPVPPSYSSNAKRRSSWHASGMCQPGYGGFCRPPWREVGTGNRRRSRKDCRSRRWWMWCRPATGGK